MAKIFDINSIQKHQYITRGLPTSVGIATGRIAFSKEMAYALNNQGERVILVKKDTEPSDIKAINLAEGLLTTTGSQASNTSIMARTLGKCSVVAPNISIKNNQMIVNKIVYQEGTIISLDGYNGNIYLGYVPIKNNLSWKEMHRQQLKANVKKYTA